jgi:hypothetical protein
MQDSQESLDPGSKDLTQEAANIPLPPEALEDGVETEQTGTPAQLPNGQPSAAHSDVATSFYKQLLES